MILYRLRYFVIACVGILISMESYAENHSSKKSNSVNHQDIIYDSYREYLKTSREYILTQIESSEQVRIWRKKRLAEIFNGKLQETEKNLMLSNTNLIEEFNKFLRENGVDSLDDVLLIRLAQLYFEKANLELNQQMKKNRTSTLLVPNYKKAILFSKLFIAKFPNSSIGDKAYYLLGFAYEEMNHPDKSIRYYEDLLNKYPTSEFAEEVKWRLGEIFYNKRQYSNAEKMYKNISKLKGSFYTKAMYKLGASYFVQKKFNEAVRVFEEVLNQIKKSNDLSLEDQTIYDESLDYLATILSNDLDIKFQEDYESEVYYRLGLLYKKRLDEKSMRVVFAAATKKFPNSKQLPLMYTEMIESYESSNEIERSNAYRSRFIQALTNNQKWWIQNENYRNVIFQTQDLLEFNLIKSAEYYAEKGYRKNNFNQLKIAKNRYYNFITKYPWSSYRDYAKLELADLEYFLGNYSKASDYYFQIVNESTSANLKEEAAYSLIWSEVKKVGYKLNLEASNIIPQNAQKTNLDPSEKVFSQAAIFYITKVKSSFRKNKVIYKLAELFAEHGDFDTSIQYLNMIISDQENSDSVTISAYRFLMEIYNIKNDWTSLASIQELYQSSFFGVNIESIDNENYRQKYRDKLEKAYNLELDEKYSEAARELEQVISENPTNSMNHFLHLKIANFYTHVGQYDRALGFCNLLASSKFSVESQFLKAQILYKTARIDEAINSLEQFALKNKKHPWFEEALLNVISLRDQTKTQNKTVELFQKINIKEISAYTFYEYIKSLLITKKFDDLYRAVNQTKKSAKYDGYRMQFYTLKAQHDRFDYLGLDKICTNLEKTLENTKVNTAYATLNKSFCEYAKLKTLAGQSDTTLNELVKRLNSIYANKIDFVTVMALTEILNKSDLRNQFRKQFDQLIKKGWSIARLNPLSEETQKLSQAILAYSGKLPLSLAYMVNWRAGLGDLFDFQSFDDKSTKWPETKLFCESKQYSECLSGLKDIQKIDTSKEVYENLIIASLKAGNDEELQKWVSEYIKTSNSSDRSQMFAYYVGMYEQTDKTKEISTNLDPFVSTARALKFWSNHNPNEAISTLTSTLKNNSDSVHSYYALAQIYFAQGYSELARTVLANGYKNTTSLALLPLLHQLDALTFSLPQNLNFELKQDQSPAEGFALAFAALKYKNKSFLEKTYDIMQPYRNWFNTAKTLELIYTHSNSFKHDSRNTNFYVQWLESLYKLSKGQDVFSLDKIQVIAQKNLVLPNYKEIERIVSEREIAGEKK